MQSHSQAFQDIFALTLTNFKKNGTFVEIGSNDPININNTYLMSKDYGWKGIMVEYEKKYEPLYKQHRPESIHIIEDARSIDYRKVLDENQFPENIEYLQIDLEVENRSTLLVLEKFDKDVFDKYKFATVTFEHDMYAIFYNFYTTQNYIDTIEESRKIFQKRGYIRLFENVILNDEYNRQFEDWYIHPDLVDMKFVEKICEEAKKLGWECNVADSNYTNIVTIRNKKCCDIYNLLQKI